MAMENLFAQVQHLQSIVANVGWQPQWQRQPPSAASPAPPAATSTQPMVQAPPAVASTQPMPTIYIEGELPPSPWVRGQPYAHVEITPVRPPFFVLFYFWFTLCRCQTPINFSEYPNHLDEVKYTTGVYSKVQTYGSRGPREDVTRARFLVTACTLFLLSL